MEQLARKRRSDYGKKRGKIGKRVELHKCSECPYNHASTGAIKTHYLNNHASEKERQEQYTYYCKLCYYGTMTKGAYNLHLKTKKHLHIEKIAADSSHG